MSLLTIVGAVQAALESEMERDPHVIIYGQDVGKSGGVFRATEGLQKKFGKKRCFDTPLSESGIVGSALGMAIAGYIPVVEIQFSGFAYNAFNQIANHIARIRNRTRGELTAPLVIRMPYGGGIKAPEHHVESLEALFAHIPGLKVVIPSSPYDTKGLLISAIRDPDPVIFMEPKRIYRALRQEVPEKSYTIPIGKARYITKGKDLTVVSYGAQLNETLKAVLELDKKGIKVELIDLRTIYPFDEELIFKSVKKTGRLLVVHEGHRSFGTAAEIIASVTSEVFTYLKAPPRRLTGPDVIVPLPRGENYYLINNRQIIVEAEKLSAYTP